MKNELERGTWTLRAATRKGASWRTIVKQSWVDDPEFLRARFVLEGGPTIFVSAEDLRRVMAATRVRADTVCPLRIDPVSFTVNGQSVSMEFER